MKPKTAPTGTVDLHTHMLCGVDDGARDREQMCAMLDRSYADGVRTLCLTPHCNPRYWGHKEREADESYAALCAYAAKRYPDLCLLRGCELFFDHDTLELIDSGVCRPLGEGRSILVDFRSSVHYFELESALVSISGRGFVPVLAHTERYLCLYREPDRIARIRERSGAYLQVNASSFFGDWGREAKHTAAYLLRVRWIDAVASDCHNLDERPPGLGAAYLHVAKKQGEDYAREIFIHRPLQILGLES